MSRATEQVCTIKCEYCIAEIMNMDIPGLVTLGIEIVSPHIVATGT